MQTVEPFSAQVFNNTMLQVSSRFDNSQVTGAYFIRTIGLFAKLGDGDPVLFEVAQAITPDEMPAQSAVAPSAFVYNMQVTIQQASQLTVTVNPAGTATVQDILTLNATKVDIDGGDISNTIAATFEASNASWPIPAAGETIKVILGKIKKHLEDLASWRPTVSLISDIVNNLTSTATDKPLAANQGRVLKESVDQLNSDMNQKSDLELEHCTSLLAYAASAPEGFCHMVRLAGSGYTGNDLPELGNYKFGSAIIMKRYAASMVVILFSPLSNGAIMINTWDDTASKWNGWYNANGTKQLWNGTLNVNGSVTIPDIDRYSAFAVVNYTYPMVMFGYKLNNNIIYGSGIDCNADYGLRAMAFQITLSGTRATLTKCKVQALFDSEAYSDDSITRIYGIL